MQFAAQAPEVGQAEYFTPTPEVYVYPEEPQCEVGKWPEEGQPEVLPASHPWHWWRWVLWALPRLLLVPFLALFFLWVFNAEGGVGLDASSLFGLHAVLMVVFVLICMQEALLVYSVPLFGPLPVPRAASKAVHAFFHLAGLGCAVGGLVAIVSYKRQNGDNIYPNYPVYTPHSWVAIAFLALWTLQLLGGAVVFALIKDEQIKQRCRTFHRFFGNVTYGVGLATCALGFQDMQSSDLSWLAMPNMTDAMASMAGMDMDMPDMPTGYQYNSILACYASACSLLLVFIGIATFFNPAR